MALQSYQILNNQRMLYFIQRFLIQKLLQKWFFQLKIALAVLGKLKSYIFTFCRLQTVPNKQVLKNRTFIFS